VEGLHPLGVQRRPALGDDHRVDRDAVLSQLPGPLARRGVAPAFGRSVARPASCPVSATSEPTFTMSPRDRSSSGRAKWAISLVVRQVPARRLGEALRVAVLQADDKVELALAVFLHDTYCEGVPRST
jgi:hypothetical protein